MGSAYALGAILGQLSGESEVRAARALSTAVFGRREPQVQVDVNALIEMIQERDEIIANLQHELDDLRARAAVVEANRDKIYTWAKRAEQKLRDLGIT